ncbi:MAG: hypothetical protein ACREFD_12235 [Stellaceae bacterium]
MSAGPSLPIFTPRVVEISGSEKFLEPCKQDTLVVERSLRGHMLKRQFAIYAAKAARSKSWFGHTLIWGEMPLRRNGLNQTRCTALQVS